jgi:Ca2+-binding EF-hand superfamily protein
LHEVPNIMRALGFYPSEHEVNNLIQEIQFEQDEEEISFEDIVQCTYFAPLYSELILYIVYVNHRPVFGIGKEQLQEAFRVLGANSSGKLALQDLTRLLRQRGETMSEEEISECFKALLDNDSEHILKEQVTAKEFAEVVLGFEDYSEEVSVESLK